MLQLHQPTQANLPAYIFMGNQGAMNMTSNLVTNKRSKRVDLRCRMIRDFINHLMIKPEYINTEHNVADIRNKPLQRVKRRCFTNILPHDQEI